MNRKRRALNKSVWRRTDRAVEYNVYDYIMTYNGVTALLLFDNRSLRKLQTFVNVF